MQGKQAQQRADRIFNIIDRLIIWIGSVQSVAFHTILFVAFFSLSILGFMPWNLMLLVLTTIVSLEAIYLAIFIQMTVNRHTKSLREVEHDIDEIEEDIDELQEDVEEMTEDDVKDVPRRQRQAAALETLTQDMQRMLRDLEELKRRS